METSLRLLILEDSEDDAAILLRELRQAGYTLDFERVETRDELTEALDRREWDLICADYTLPGFRGTTALTMVRERGLEVPFIFVSATIGEDVAVEAMKAGANDYVLKDNLKRLVPAVQRELLDLKVRRDRARLEAELLQAQRLEIVGRLAGGLAHDLNNLLTVIGSHAQLLLTDAPLAPHHVSDLLEINRAVERAASLTHQLLAFTRQQVLDLQVLDLNELVRETERMMGRVLGERIKVVSHLAQDLRPIEADAGQLQQVLLNLVLNARDAMPGGGTVSIATWNGDGGGEGWMRADGAEPAGTDPGALVTLSVRDTGHGMDAATLERIFDPFFTTKGPGEGTGLGLPTAYGIVAQLGGHIRVRSEPDGGSEFLIHLPAARFPAA